MALAPPASPSLALRGPAGQLELAGGVLIRGAQGEEGLVRGMGWSRQARAGESGVPVGRGRGQHGSVVLASHQPSGVPGEWVVPPPWRGRSGERGRLVPPHG